MKNEQLLKSLMSPLGRLLFLFLLCLLGSELAAQIPAVTAFNQSWIDAHTRHNGVWGLANFILVATVLITLGLPRQLAAFLGGYAFGFVEGLIYSTLAVTLSCLLSVYIARLYARPVITRLLSNKIQKVDLFLTDQPMIKTIIIRLLPIGNNMITNLIAGVSKIKIRSFLLGSFIGYIPQMLIFSLMGKGVVVQSVWKIVLSIVLLGISSFLGIYLYKKYKADKLLNQTQANVLITADTAIK